MVLAAAYTSEQSPEFRKSGLPQKMRMIGPVDSGEVKTENVRLFLAEAAQLSRVEVSNKRQMIVLEEMNKFESL